jgi:glycosyltransferase involved in cell wall biosynthesis
VPLQLSIVTPSYNQGRFLADTIESVLSQEGDFALDYRVLDGGSQDNSVDVIRRYDDLVQRGTWPLRCRSLRFRWHSERDRGQSDAIAKGFAVADGEVLAWLNSDDTYASGTLARAAERFTRTPELALLYGKSQFVDEHGTPTGMYPTRPFDTDSLAAFNFIAQPSTFFRRRALDAVGGIGEHLHYVMDYDLWIRLSRHSTPEYIPEVLSTFRLHSDSKTISPAHALANQTETLETVERHYGWSPINRVFAYEFQRVRARFPAALHDRSRVPAALLSVPVAAVSYLRRNRGVRLADLEMITPKNLRKMFLDPTELSKEYG